MPFPPFSMNTKPRGWIVRKWVDCSKTSYIHSLPPTLRPAYPRKPTTVIHVYTTPFHHTFYRSTQWPTVLHMFRTGGTVQYQLSFRLGHHKYPLSFNFPKVQRYGVVGVGRFSLFARCPFPATPSQRYQYPNELGLTPLPKRSFFAASTSHVYFTFVFPSHKINYQSWNAIMGGINIYIPRMPVSRDPYTYAQQ